jgi:hypothetical protein
MNAKIAYAVAALAATAFLSNVTTVQATVVVPEEFHFTGECGDCTGTGIGTLTLSDYTLGASLQLSNFVSFTYHSNLLDLSYPADGAITSISGSLAILPGPNNVGLQAGSGNYVFFSNATFWCAGANSCSSDFGSISSWSAATATTPLPAALPLFASGLGMCGLLVWRRKQKASVITD